MNVGIFPCKSNKVWSFTAALVLQSAQCPFKLKRLLMDQLKPKKVAVVAMASKNVRGVPGCCCYKTKRSNTIMHRGTKGECVLEHDDGC